MFPSTGINMPFAIPIRAGAQYLGSLTSATTLSQRERVVALPGAHFLLSFPSHLWYLAYMFAFTGPCAAVGPVSLLPGLQGPRWTFTPSLIKFLTSSVSGSA